MALSSTAFYSRMDRDFKLLGSPGSDSKTDILVDAVNEYLKDMDNPRISATLAVTQDDLVYDIPDTIDKISDIRNEDGDSVNYTIDETVRQINLQDAPSASVNYTMYGTTKSIRTNLDAVVAAIPENDELVLWEFIRAFAHRRAHSNESSQILNEAKLMAQEKRNSKNKSIGLGRSHNVRHIDVRGRVIGDSDNRLGLSVQIDDQFESDL